MADENGGKKWTFLTNHAHVLLCIAHAPRSRLTDIANAVGITERATQLILADLIEAAYVTRTKIGRRNEYEVHGDGDLRHPMVAEHEVQKLIEILTPEIPHADDAV